MKPWQEAKKWQLENSELDFEELLGASLNGGFVWSSDSEFALFTKVRVEQGELVEGEPNAWYVQLAAGKKPFKRLMEVAPGPMDFVCYRRGKTRLHIWPWEIFKRKVK